MGKAVKKTEYFDSLCDKDPADLDQAKATIFELKSRIEELEQLIKSNQAARFQRSSEVTVHPDQPSLFNEAEEICDQGKPADESEEITYTRKKNRGKRTKIDPSLHRVEVVHDLTEDEKICACGCQLTQMGSKTSEKLIVEPAKAHVEVHIRKTYSCNSCKETVKTAPAPKQLLPKSIASAELMAFLIVQKYANHMPLYRLEVEFERLGIKLDRTSMARWMIATSEALQGIYNLSKDEVISSALIQMDETRLQVNKERGKKASSHSFMWVLACNSPKPIVIFDYQKSRSGKVVEEHLEGFSGKLITDAYAPYISYASSNGITHGLCWDHARRPFAKIVKFLSKSPKSSMAYDILVQINTLYTVERDYGKKGLKALKIARDLYTKGVLSYLKKLLEQYSLKASPKSELGKGISYILRYWDQLTVFADDPEMPISNILAENAIRPLALGRKNWLFADTPRGANASAIIFSVVETMRANGINLYQGLTKLLTKLPEAETTEDLISICPWLN